MWVYSPKIAKIGNFWYKFFPKGYIPLSDIYKIWYLVYHFSDIYKIWHGRESQVPTLTPNFTVVVLKRWAYRPQISKIGNLWYNDNDNGITDWIGPIMLIILFLVSHSNFLFVPCGRLSWLPVSFLLHVKYIHLYSPIW